MLLLEHLKQGVWTEVGPFIAGVEYRVEAMEFYRLRSEDAVKIFRPEEGGFIRKP